MSALSLPDRFVPIARELVEPGDDLIALRVNGHCMEPAIEHGSYVVMARGASWADGQIVVATAGNSWFVKRAYRQGNDVVLRADAPGWPDVHGASVVGVVRSVWR